MSRRPRAWRAQAIVAVARRDGDPGTDRLETENVHHGAFLTSRSASPPSGGAREPRSSDVATRRPAIQHGPRAAGQSARHARVRPPRRAAPPEGHMTLAPVVKPEHLRIARFSQFPRIADPNRRANSMPRTRASA
jgi:hypothetical protein